MKMLKKKVNPKDEDHNLIGDGLTAMAYSDLKSAKKTYHVVIGALSVTVLMLSMMAFSKKTEIVVMPPDYYESVIVNGAYANEAYSAGHAMTVANLMGNVNDKNIDFVHDVIMRMLSPYLRSQIQQALQTEVQILKSRRARQSFYVEDVMFDANNNIVFVWGNKRTSAIGMAEISERFTYELKIEPQNGMPKITHFDAYPGAPKPRNPDQPLMAEPYLTRDLELARLLASTQAKPIEQVAQPNAAQAPTPTSPTDNPLATAPANSQEQN